MLWSYADSLHLHPHPDFLVLADEGKDYHYEVPVNGHQTSYQADQKLGNEDDHNIKTIHVVNPGNFGSDKSFVVIYPDAKDNCVQPSKI